MGLRSPRPLALVAAVLLPLLVLATGWRVLRDPPVAGAHDDAITRSLRGQRPRVVVLGSSLAHRGIDPVVLARELGVPAEEVVVLQLPHASAAHWYAILKNEIVARGLEPEIVLVAGAMTTMLNHELLAENPANVERLGSLLTDDEPVIAAKVFGLPDSTEFRRRFWRAAAVRWRELALDRFRDAVLAAGLSGRARYEEASRLAERADAVVFPNEAMDYALHRSAAAPRPRAFTAVHGDAWSLRDHALLPDLDALADGIGARLVFVRMPFPPSNPDVDAVPPDIEAEAIAWIAELGATWVDLRTLDLSDDDFEDMRHLSRRGAALFSAALGRVIASGAATARGAAGFGEPEARGEGAALVTKRVAPCEVRAPLPPAAGLRPARFPAGAGAPVRVTVDGTEAGEGAALGCDGTWRLDDDVVVVAASGEVRVAWAARAAPGLGWWVAPGTSVVWPGDGWRGAPTGFAALVRATGSPGAGATLRLGDDTTSLGGEGGRRVGLLHAAPPPGAFELAVAVHDGDAPIFVHHLAVGLPPETVPVVGRAETLYGASVRVLGGRADDTRVAVSYAAPPGFPPRRVVPTRGPRRLGHLALPGLADLADAEERDAARPDQCSPVRVLEDGEPLAAPHAPCFDVMTLGQGRSCHAGPDLWFASSDDTDPLRNRRTYTIDLDPSRSCATLAQPNAATLRGSRWLYPGDEATFVASAERLAAFRDGADTVVVAVLPLVAPPEVPIELVLRADGVEVARTAWTPDASRRIAEHRWTLPRRLSPRVGSLELVLRNPSPSTFHLVTLLAVEEASPLARPVEDRPLDPARAAAVTLRRTGEVPAVPALGEVARDRDGVSSGALPALAPVSQPALDRLGLGAWSPLRLRVAGQVLAPIASKRALLTGCVDCLLHQGAQVMWRSAREGRPEPYLEPAFPMPARQGPVAWVYPGQTVVVGLDAPASRAELRVLAFHADPARVGEGASVVVGDEAFDLVPDGTPAGFAAVVPLHGGRELGVRNGSSAGLLLLASVDRLDADGAVRVWALPEAAPGRPER